MAPPTQPPAARDEAGYRWVADNGRNPCPFRPGHRAAARSSALHRVAHRVGSRLCPVHRASRAGRRDSGDGALAGHPHGVLLLRGAGPPPRSSFSVRSSPRPWRICWPRRSAPAVPSTTPWSAVGLATCIATLFSLVPDFVMGLITAAGLADGASWAEDLLRPSLARTPLTPLQPRIRVVGSPVPRDADSRHPGNGRQSGSPTRAVAVAGINRLRRWAARDVGHPHPGHRAADAVWPDQPFRPPLRRQRRRGPAGSPPAAVRVAPSPPGDDGARPSESWPAWLTSQAPTLTHPTARLIMNGHRQQADGTVLAAVEACGSVDQGRALGGPALLHHPGRRRQTPLLPAPPRRWHTASPGGRPNRGPEVAVHTRLWRLVGCSVPEQVARPDRSNPSGSYQQSRPLSCQARR